MVENKSLWRIKNNYKADESMDMEVKVWNFIEKDKEELIKILTEKLDYKPQAVFAINFKISISDLWLNLHGLGVSLGGNHSSLWW